MTSQKRPLVISIQSNVPSATPPSWAVWQRRLIETMSQSVDLFREKYTHADGSLIWRDENDDNFQTRDGADDFYESFYNWALLYLIGGHDKLLDLAHFHWDAITKQLTRLGLVHKEYERGYDQFHQGESYIYFYFLCLADPENPKLLERAKRFAGFYLNEDPDAINYDPEHKLIRAPHNGSVGARWGYFDSEIAYGWYADMAPYGLPYHDVEGIKTYDDLKDPELAKRMGEVMEYRMGKGDVATNLIVTSLITNAYLMTGNNKYVDWVVAYVSAWQKRAENNSGFLPDNIGLSGEVGEYMDGKWYGGLYGWAWPHGYYNIGMAAVVAGANAYLLTQDDTFLDLPRSQIDVIHDLAQIRTLQELADTYGSFWVIMLDEYAPDTEFFVAPYRYKDFGWFDYQSPTAVYPIAVWNLTFSERDWQRIELLRQHDVDDWRDVKAFRNKEDAGHDAPWLCFLKGENPHYPEQILSASYGQVARRMDMIRRDDKDLSNVSIHHWQELNPVLTEALVQLTLGAPQVIYNGGLLMCQARYFDVEKQRVGLPPDVASLVEKVEYDSISIHLVNLSILHERDLIIQAGAFGEHQFHHIQYEKRISDYPGKQGAQGYAAPDLKTETQTITVNDSLLRILLPAATEIILHIKVERFVNQPSYQLPWGRLE
ncbi:MAG: hypothetical protein WBC91_04900 [Phototrophicaceae bacterium]